MNFKPPHFVIVNYSCTFAAIPAYRVIKYILTIAVFSLTVQSLIAQSTLDSVFAKQLSKASSEPPIEWHYLQGQLVSVIGYNPDHKKLILVGAGSALLWTGSFIALNKAWYSDYDKTSFHFFNDNKEWQQVDKAGHIWTSYQVSRASTEAWRWTGLKPKTSTILGAISGVAYQTIIEIQDGYSEKWGFSPGDMGANLLGAGAFMLQELKWHDQRISIKLSYRPYSYGDLKQRRNELFGSSFSERILKDYNSQTYWLSGNIHSLFTASKWPAWLNIAIGYKGDGMLGGYENKWTDDDGNMLERMDIKRTRHFYLSPDIDFTKIKTDSRVLRKIFFLMNAVKIPAPAIEINGRGKLRLHALYF